MHWNCSSASARSCNYPVSDGVKTIAEGVVRSLLIMRPGLIAAVTHHRYIDIDGHTIFYRESGPKDAPTIVLLHGYPSSSYSFRELIPRLADRYHVIAPDHLGFGFSDAPPVDEFTYSFDALTKVTAALLARLNVDRYALYLHDYGAPIGWRLAVANPEAITGIVSQNGNGYEEGFVEDFWVPIWLHGREPSLEHETALQGALSLDVIRWMYVTGEPDETFISPETWQRDHALLSRPGNDRVQLALFGDYINNVAQYKQLHTYFQATKVPLLAVWGAGDPTFRPEGAQAFTKHLPDAQVHLLTAGHFALESQVDEISRLVRDFLAGVATT
jgi:pimeloyl-ACP methyl ester carboxylesterase